MTNPSATDAELLQEMAYTESEVSCFAPAVYEGVLYECRRPKWHPPGQHAAGTGPVFRWGCWYA